MLISHQRLATPSLFSMFSAISKKNTLLTNYLPRTTNHYWASSARTAIKSLLEQLKIQDVLLPAFTCKVVLNAIKLTPAKPILFDSGLFADYKKFKDKIKETEAKVLLLPYNMGFLPEIDKIQALCKKKKVLLIEDCAQALGATYNNKSVGNFGDFSIFSFGISKNIGFYGGLLCSKNHIHIETKNTNFPAFALAISKSCISKYFFNPHIYSLTSHLLKFELRREHKFNKEDYYNYTLPKVAKRIIVNQLLNYKKILTIRTTNALKCAEELDGYVDFVKPIKRAKPSWLYFVLVAQKREKMLKLLRKQNVELQPLQTFKNLGSLKQFPEAEEFSNSYLTFALYRPEQEINYIIEKVKKVSKQL